MGNRPTPTQRREAELQALHWIAQAVNFTMPLDDIMELIYTQIHRVTPVPNFYIALADPESRTLAYAFYIEDDERRFPDLVWPLDFGLTGLIIKTGATIRTRDYLKECRAQGIQPGGKPGRAWMGASLTGRDKSIGVMVASTYDENQEFTAEDESFFTTVAAYTASAIERRQLHTGLETRAQQMKTLIEIGNLLASSLDIDTVLDLVVLNAAKLVHAEGGSLLLLDHASGDLIFRISTGPVGVNLIGRKMPAGKGIAGVCFAENRPVIVNDTHDDRRWYSGIDQQAQFSTESIVAVPLNARGNTIGVLEVINARDKHGFTQEDIDLLLSFGAQAAIAIENARLFTTTDKALQERVEELTTLQHIDRQLNATLDYREVMSITLDWARRITGATIGLIAALHETEDGKRGLQILAHHGYDLAEIEPYIEDELWPLEKGLIGLTMRQGKTTIVRSVESNPHYLAVVPGMKAQLTAPIQRESRVIGVIALESENAETFSENAVESVTRLADHAAIAIDNARLFQQIQRANQAKTEFVSFVSHELKQPMTSMKGYTDLLIKGIGGPLNDQQKQFLEVIRSNVQRMDRLVQDVLDVSRIEAGRLRLEKSSVRPADIVAEAVQTMAQAIREKQQVLDVEIAADLPTVYGDRGRLLQVLINLLSNAHKYTPEKGSISTSVDQVEVNNRTYVRWQVQDTGIGMTVEEMEKLFTKYFRSDNPMVRNVKGTGLGLVITRSIVELHEGQVSVQSNAGEGSTFSFVIPAETP
ncbi:MAG: GAF domain-containing protein [Anaerolineae bacterium]|nr:GAF domain-containing protein [Anaerolineae bacterium]